MLVSISSRDEGPPPSAHQGANNFQAVRTKLKVLSLIRKRMTRIPHIPLPPPPLAQYSRPQIDLYKDLIKSPMKGHGYDPASNLKTPSQTCPKASRFQPFLLLSQQNKFELKIPV